MTLTDWAQEVQDTQNIHTKRLAKLDAQVSLHLEVDKSRFERLEERIRSLETIMRGGGNET